MNDLLDRVMAKIKAHGHSTEECLCCKLEDELTEYELAQPIIAEYLALQARHIEAIGVLTEDAIAEEMDGVWKAMTSRQRDEVRRRSRESLR